MLAENNKMMEKSHFEVRKSEECPPKIEYLYLTDKSYFEVGRSDKFPPRLEYANLMDEHELEIGQAVNVTVVPTSDQLLQVYNKKSQGVPVILFMNRARNRLKKNLC